MPSLEVKVGEAVHVGVVFDVVITGKLVSTANATFFKIGSLRGNGIRLPHVAIKGKKVSEPYGGVVKRSDVDNTYVISGEDNGSCEI